jgi:hypothetical protein
MQVCKTCGAQWNQDDLLQAGHKFGNAACQSCGFDPRLWPQNYTAVFTAEEWEQDNR